MPEIIESGLNSESAFLCAVPKPYHPFTAVAQMVELLFVSFCSKRCYVCVSGARKRFKQRHAKCVKQKLARHCDAKISVWLFYKANVSKLPRVT
jgi:hypothetical protein